MSDEVKILLDESHIPTHWYNIQADLPRPLDPVIHPGTKQPVGPEDLAPLFPMAIIAQEVSQERYIQIPEPIRDVYRLWRPTPLYRARRLEQTLDTPARIYYKYEGVSPAGSHKPNTAVAQAYYNKQEGVTRLCTETGAGQWGSALALACQMLGIECKVYMVRVSFTQKPYRRSLMQTWGARVVPSPSRDTEAGRKALEADPDSPGSFVPPGIHAGGLRYHGMAPLVSLLCDLGVVESRAVHQIPTFQAAVQFARSEGIVPAPESAHAIRVAVDEALAAREHGEPRTILFNLSGHGHFDLGAYDEFFAGNLQDYAYPSQAVEEAMAGLPEL